MFVFSKIFKLIVAFCIIYIHNINKACIRRYKMKKKISILIAVVLIVFVMFGCDFDKYKVKVSSTTGTTKITTTAATIAAKTTTQTPTKTVTTTQKSITTKRPTTIAPTTVAPTTAPPTTVMAQPTRTIQYTQNGQQKSITVTVITGFENEMIASVNEQRAAAGVPPLALDSRLSELAIIRAAEAGVQWSHTRPDGTQCFTVLDNDPELKSHIVEAGENLAWNQTTVPQVMTDWMNSPGHRANIVKYSYNYVGLACVIVYRDNGSKDHLWAQMFAKIE